MIKLSPWHLSVHLRRWGLSVGLRLVVSSGSPGEVEMDFERLDFSNNIGVSGRWLTGAYLAGNEEMIPVITTRWCPPVISWFINPINYSYICHKP